jgi:hypothetical protein
MLPSHEKPLPPIEPTAGRRSKSSSRPPLPAKDIERRRSRSSMLQVVSNPDLLSPNGFVPKERHRKQPFFNHLLSLRNWIKETSKRAKSPNSKASSPGKKSPKLPESKSPDSRRRLGAVNRHSAYSQSANLSSSHLPPRPRISTNGSGNTRRLSASPAPLTPRSSYRRSSGGGLRGRKSTSSSVSSIRSMPHHHHSHSKASSTSSISIGSPSVSVSGHKHTKSPHSSVKVLPATPTSSSFPSNIRLVRNPNSNLTAEGNSAFGAVPPPSPGFPSGLVFAKRKRSPFKGPMLNTNMGAQSSSPAGGAAWRRAGESGSRSHSVQGRRSGEIMGITEEEEEEEDVEEVDDFNSPSLKPGEFVEEEEEEDGGTVKK